MRLLFYHLATVLKLSVMRWSLGARWRAFTRWQALQPRAETQWAVQLRAGQTALEAGASFDEVEENSGVLLPPSLSNFGLGSMQPSCPLRAFACTAVSFS